MKVKKEAMTPREARDHMSHMGITWGNKVLRPTRKVPSKKAREQITPTEKKESK